MEMDERTSSTGPAGVMAMACTHRRPGATRETPAMVIYKDQLATRERWAGSREVAERSVVPRKPADVAALLDLFSDVSIDVRW